MSQWTDHEIELLKKKLKDKRVRDEKSVQDTNLRNSKGPDFWNETKEATKKAVNVLNDGVGEIIIDWESEKPELVTMKGNGVLSGPNLTFKFDPRTFVVNCTALATQKRFSIITDTGELYWKEDNHNNKLTANEAAEKIVACLTRLMVRL